MSASPLHRPLQISLLVGLAYLVLAGPVSAATSGGWTLALRAGLRQSREATERFAWLALALPLDEWASDGAAARRAPGPGAVSAEPGQEPHQRPPERPTDAEAPPSDAAPPPRLPRSGAEADPPAPQLLPPTEAARSVPAEAATPTAAGGLSESLVRDAVERALAHAGVSATRERLDSLASRSRSAALLPQLRLRGGRSTDESLRLSPTLDDPYRYTETGGSDLFFEAQLTWRLDRLVYAADELNVERLRAQGVARRQKLTDTVLELLAAWLQGRVLASDTALAWPKRVRAWLLGCDARYRLAALTGGWFADATAELDFPTRARRDDLEPDG